MSNHWPTPATPVIIRLSIVPAWNTHTYTKQLTTKPLLGQEWNGKGLIHSVTLNSGQHDEMKSSLDVQTSAAQWLPRCLKTEGHSHVTLSRIGTPVTRTAPVKEKIRRTCGAHKWSTISSCTIPLNCLSHPATLPAS